MIGRADAAHLLSGPQVSRRHAAIQRPSDRFIIYDLGSMAGTIVDGREVRGNPIKGGDRIVLGASTIAVVDPEVGQG